jgi:hypothetical protein
VQGHHASYLSLFVIHNTSVSEEEKIFANRDSFARGAKSTVNSAAELISVIYSGNDADLGSSIDLHSTIKIFGQNEKPNTETWKQFYLKAYLDKIVFILEKESMPYWNKFLQGYYDQSGVSSSNFDQALKSMNEDMKRVIRDAKRKKQEK